VWWLGGCGGHRGAPVGDCGARVTPRPQNRAGGFISPASRPQNPLPRHHLAPVVGVPRWWRSCRLLVGLGFDRVPVIGRRCFRAFPLSTAPMLGTGGPSPSPDDRCTSAFCPAPLPSLQSKRRTPARSWHRCSRTCGRGPSPAWVSLERGGWVHPAGVGGGAGPFAFIRARWGVWPKGGGTILAAGGPTPPGSRRAPPVAHERREEGGGAGGEALQAGRHRGGRHRPLQGAPRGRAVGVQ